MTYIPLNIVIGVVKDIIWFRSGSEYVEALNNYQAKKNRESIFYPLVKMMVRKKLKYQGLKV